MRIPRSPLFQPWREALACSMKNRSKILPPPYPAKRPKGLGRTTRSAIASGLITLVLLLGACARLSLPPTPEQPTSPPPLALHPVAHGELPGWESDHHGAILPVFLRSCQKITKRPPEQDFGPSPKMGKIHHWIALCRTAARIPPGDDEKIRRFLENEFTPYAVGTIRKTNARTGLFTGYYEPDLRGALRPDARFSYPILARPRDLISIDLGPFHHKWRNRKIHGRLHKGRFVPYYDRAQIEAGALDGRRLEILWLDPIDAFFLHIQGSGRARLPDGSTIRLGYAGRNGYPYTAIGRELIASGQMTREEVSAPAIRRWLRANPKAGRDLMRKNRAYIFFRVRADDRASAGPIGAQGVTLTPGRSLAVDPDHIPFGAPLWLATQEPGTRPPRPLRRLVVAQDTGSAIRGVVRGDLFWGTGEQAAEKAGIMREMGRYYLLLPRAAALPPTD
uniref:Membrane-bound lytic murein transglycosylase A n=1 Tax=Candidatus Kentrum sp. LPFa TaxID=2126335 RepID=A0A450X7D2_9GAMM|nr:MAG: membrane-bound lytic murein transglycosylase A [Candidatus Kentron sp. LPFa]VFK25186.1 MAG: membrane-bound lytic murein transglycosylase A [Candidatus Kentron sp. LPFa]